ncbi:MAG: TIGR00725 family protein [Firmicutes bacterium]|nr:TIGR00725 family protein [Bacillota bacterium]
MRRKIIAIIGDAICEEGSQKFNLAYEAGKAVIDAGFRLQCGGYGGVMNASCKGARSSSKYREGDIIGIVPSFNPADANGYVDISIATGLDLFRNIIVANADAVIAVGGGAGTLTEIANAWLLKRLIVAFSNCNGWSEKVAGTRLDGRVRYPNIPDDKIYGVTSANEALEVITRLIDKYTAHHHGIGACE